MSKSRGTGISPLRYLELGMNPEWLRYYIAAKLNANVEDIDFNPDDFLARVNSDLVGKYVNIASRAAGFIDQALSTGKVLPVNPSRLVATAKCDHARDGRRRKESLPTTKIGNSARRSGEVMDLADRINEAIDKEKPWELAKDPGKSQRLHEVCSDSIDAFRSLTIFLAPILPHTSERAAQMLGLELPLRWAQLQQDLPTKIRPFEHLITASRKSSSICCSTSPPCRRPPPRSATPSSSSTPPRSNP